VETPEKAGAGSGALLGGAASFFVSDEEAAAVDDDGAADADASSSSAPTSPNTSGGLFPGQHVFVAGGSGGGPVVGGGAAGGGARAAALAPAGHRLNLVPAQPLVLREATGHADAQLAAGGATSQLLRPERDGPALLPMLPVGLLGRALRLVYSAEAHGRSLETLYSRCQGAREGPMLLLLEALGGGQRLGVFSSHRWSRSPKHYGSGSCFALSLHPVAAHYPWVPRRPVAAGGGEEAGSGGGGGAGGGGGERTLAAALAAVVDAEDGAEKAAAVADAEERAGAAVAAGTEGEQGGAGEAAKETAAGAAAAERRPNGSEVAVDFFMHSTASVLIMGGSAASSSAALRLDKELLRGFSQRCDTFLNEPLAGEGSEEFEVGQVEVFDFVLG
jgi:hypothetical protein